LSAEQARRGDGSLPDIPDARQARRSSPQGTVSGPRSSRHGGFSMEGERERAAREAIEMRQRVSLVAFLAGTILAATTTYAAPKENPTSVEDLKNELIAGRPQEQLSAMDELAKKGSPAIDALCDVIEKNKDHRAKERATQTLEKILSESANRSPAAIDKLARMLDNDDRKVVESSARALMYYKRNSRVRELLKRAARNARDKDTRSALLGSVMNASDRDKSEAPFFEGFLTDESEHVRLWAAGYLGLLGNTRGLVEVRRVLSQEPTTDSIRTLQMRAAIASGRIGDPSLIPQLERIGKSPEHGLASKAARTAILEIRMAQLSTQSERIDYLRNLLTNADSVRWGISQLMSMGDAPAIEALRWASKNAGEPGAFEAKRALSVLDVKGKGQ